MLKIGRENNGESTREWRLPRHAQTRSICCFSFSKFQDHIFLLLFFFLIIDNNLRILVITFLQEWEETVCGIDGID